MPSGGDQLRAGILGYGVVGRRRRQLIDARSDMVTTAICDAAGVLDPAGARVAADLGAMLREPLDVLFVCATPAVAPGTTVAGLERGLHVFCEKPPARTANELEPVLRAERAHPTQVLRFGFNHRLHGTVRAARELVAGGTLGELVSMRGVYGRDRVAGSASAWRADPLIAGGGILLDQGIHLADLMLLFAGDFETVHAFTGRRTSGLPVEDNAWALMKSSRGVVAELCSSATEWRPRFLLELTLTRGAVVLEGLQTSSGLYAPERLLVRPRAGDERELTFAEDTSWQEEIEEFVTSIRKRVPARDGTSHDALAVMKLIDRIYAGARVD